MVLLGTISEVPGSSSHIFSLHLICIFLFTDDVENRSRADRPSYSILSEVSAQVICPLFMELCVFSLGYRSSGACHILKRALQMVFRTFDQNKCILVHSISLMPHQYILLISHIIFLSSDTTYTSLLAKLTYFQLVAEMLNFCLISTKATIFQTNI